MLALYHLAVFQMIPIGLLGRKQGIPSLKYLIARKFLCFNNNDFGSVFESNFPHTCQDGADSAAEEKDINPNKRDIDGQFL